MDDESHLGSSVEPEEEELNALEGCGTRSRTKSDSTKGSIPLSGLAKDLSALLEVMKGENIWVFWPTPGGGDWEAPTWHGHGTPEGTQQGVKCAFLTEVRMHSCRHRRHRWSEVLSTV